MMCVNTFTQKVWTACAVAKPHRSPLRRAGRWRPLSPAMKAAACTIGQTGPATTRIGCRTSPTVEVGLGATVATVATGCEHPASAIRRSRATAAKRLGRMGRQRTSYRWIGLHALLAFRAVGAAWTRT